MSQLDVHAVENLIAPLSFNQDFVVGFFLVAPLLAYLQLRLHRLGSILRLLAGDDTFIFRVLRLHGIEQLFVLSRHVVIQLRQHLEHHVSLIWHQR